jgi:hypothetical protein
MIPSHQDNHGLDTSRNALVGVGDTTNRGGPLAVMTSSAGTTAGGERPDLTDEQLMALVTDAESLSSRYMETAFRTAWTRAYKAYRNEHFDGSKYLSDQFKARSKIFRPKTRSAVRKNMAAAAEALFSTMDAITIAPQDEADPMQRASAAIKHELINYRLSRNSGKAGIAWFQIAIGARQDSQLTGVCVSKQSWRYLEAGGKVREDRPEITLYPPENVLIDPSAHWVNPAQSGIYLILRNPMQVDDIMTMMRPNGMSLTPWRTITEEKLRSFASSPMDALNTRRARQGGVDNQDRTTTGRNFGVVWVYEVFMRIGGEEYCWWTIEGRHMLSDPVRTEVVYPANGGERPVTIGFGSLDAHTPIPMSPVETWQQLQQEANDLANLRLDHMKQVVSPITKVRRGRQVDLQQIQKRGPNTVVLLKDLDDVEFDRPQDVPPSAHTESAYINNDFDDIAGSFNQASVQGNRQLNETVGGMRLLSGSANAITEFDLRVWVETWVEPTLSQILKLEEMFENDETLLAIAGERAKLFQRYGIDEITDRLLMQESLVRVNVGTGAGTSDPLQKLKKFQMAAETLGSVLEPYAATGQMQLPPLDIKAITDEVFGAAGYKDGGERFFIDPDNPEQDQPPEQPPSPEQMQAQAEAAAAKQKAEQSDAAFQAEMAAKAQQHDQKMQQAALDAQRKAEADELKRQEDEHQANLRARQRELDLQRVEEAAEAKRAEEQIKVRSAADLAELKEAEARIAVEAAREAAEVKALENAVRKRELEVKQAALDVQEEELESKRRQIKIAEESAKVQAQAAKSKAEAAEKEANEPTPKPAAGKSGGGAAGAAPAKPGSRTIEFVKDAAGNITGAKY